MSSKTRANLNRTADMLEKGINGLLNAIELVLIDFTFRKGKYRKRGAKMRPIIHRTYNRTVYIRREMLPTEQLQVKARKEA